MICDIMTMLHRDNAEFVAKHLASMTNCTVIVREDGPQRFVVSGDLPLGVDVEKVEEIGFILASHVFPIAKTIPHANLGKHKISA